MATKERLMTVQDFKELRVVNYSLGKDGDVYFLTLIRVSGDPKLQAFPIFDKESKFLSYQITEELFDHLMEVDI